MIKTVLAYDIVEGVDEDVYNNWIVNVHAPDILANPYVDRLLFDTVLRPVTSTSGGGASIDNPKVPYRVAEIHFKDEESYKKSLEWFRDHPISVERGPQGRTDFHFYVLTKVVEIDRDNLGTVDKSALRAPAAATDAAR